MKIQPITFLLLALAWPADAANCKKGLPCRGSCIAWDKICRINQPTTASPLSTKPPAASAAAPTGAQGAQNSTG